MRDFTPNPKSLHEQTPCEIDTQIADLSCRLYQLFLDRKSAEGLLETSQSASARRGFRATLEANEACCRVLNTHNHRLAVEFTRRGGWKRYFLVHGGHVHRERECSTCTVKTVFQWLPELSGCDEDAMVQQYGDDVCAVCFPDVVTHPAYIAGQAHRAAHEQAQRQFECEGSETYATRSELTPNGRYVRCYACGRTVKLRQDGMVRRHRPT